MFPLCVKGSSRAPGGWNNGVRHSNDVLQARADVKNNKYKDVHGVVHKAFAPVIVGMSGQIYADFLRLLWVLVDKQMRSYYENMDSQILCPGNRAQLDSGGKPRYSQYGEIQMDLCRGPVGTTGNIESKAQSSNDPVEFPFSHSPTTTKTALLLPKDTSGQSKRKLDMSPHGSGFLHLLHLFLSP